MFRYFRRNQKLFIVVGGVILMFVFLVGDPLMQMVGSGNQQGGPSPNAVAVRWEGGELTNAELSQAIDQRRVLDAFLTQVWRQGYALADLENKLDSPPSVRPVGLLRQSPEYDTGLTSAQVQQTTVIDHILAQRAQKLGMNISDEAVEIYLADLGWNMVGADQMQAVLDNMGNRHINAEFVVESVREAMLANAMLRMYGVGTMTLAEMPVNRWEGWRAVNDHIMLEVAALPAEQFAANVPPPTEEQLREYYEQHKEREPAPQFVQGVELPAPDPGFAIPRRVELQYLRANFNDFVDRFKQEVTDEEVAQYYEENKGQFRPAFSLDSLQFPDFDQSPEAEQPQAEADSTQPTPEGDQPPSEAPESESTETPAEPTPGDAPAIPSQEQPADAPASEPEAPAAEEPTTQEPASEEPAPEEPATEVPGSEEPAEPNAQGSDEPEASARARSPFRLVAFQDQEEQPEEPAPAPEDAPAEPEATDPAEEDLQGPATPPATSQSESDAAATDSETTDEDAATPDEPSAEAETAEADEPEYLPLEEVADEIRGILARERFQNHIDEVMATIFERLRGASRKYTEQLLAVEGTDKPLPEPPEILRDLSPLAKEFSLQYERTKPLSFFQLREEEVGKSVESQQYHAPVWEVLHQIRVDPYDPMLSETDGGGRFGDRYLLMKTSDTPRRVPSYDEVKDQVRDAWIEAEASKLALKRAEEYAQKAQEAGQTLKDFFLNDDSITVANTNSFTRMTPGDAAMPGSMPSYKLSQPEGVQSVGPEFMEEVFALKDEEIGAAPNHDGSVAYVIRVADKVETDDVLRREFLASADSWPGRASFLQGGTERMNQQLMMQLREELDIEFTQVEQTDADDE